jgi:hypothetical protein
MYVNKHDAMKGYWWRVTLISQLDGDVHCLVKKKVCNVWCSISVRPIVRTTVI